MTTLRYALHPTPVGHVLICAVDDAVVAVEVLDAPPEHAIERISRKAGLPVEHDTEHADAVLVAVAEQLDEYFEGERTDFDVPLDWRLAGGGFRRDALLAVCDIPYGETASYGEVAILAGKLRAARAVGTACATTPFSIIVPVHRVVRSDGSLGEYGGHPEIKRFLVELEHESGARAASAPPDPADE